ncbi:MAG: STAS domain-containing protein [Desulfonatronovibrionaceae bacterium]
MTEEAVFKMPENIVSTTAEDLRSRLKEALDQEPPGLVLDMQETRYVDSMGIGVLIAAYNSCRNKQVEFKVINVDKEILELFTTMRLDQHFSIQSAGEG